MSRKHALISNRIAWYVRGMLPLVTLMAAQAATGIDETMPAAIPPAIIADWEAQDAAATHTTKAQIGADIDSIVKKLNPPYSQLVTNDSTKASYYKACHYRRVVRIKPNSAELQNILYARHHDLGGPSVGYLEEMQNDPFTTGMGTYGAKGSVSGAGYTPGGALLLLKFQNCYPTPTTLLADPAGCIRDPSITQSGNKVVFAWSKDNNGYHIYEMSIYNTSDIRQLTNDTLGLTVSDFQPLCVPNGDIIFNSSRCFSGTPFGASIVSNLFVMNKDGKYLRRLGYDMGNTFYPTLRSDASLLYSRWEFNDRNHYRCFGLFRMYMDGTFQTEMWGNQTSWPVAIYQGREIPGNKKEILAIIGGNTGPSYYGDIAVLSPSNDRNSPTLAVKLVAPKRSNPTSPDLIAGVVDSARHFQDPYPLTEDNNWFLISYRKNNTSDKLFKIYLMNLNGMRELLAWDTTQSVSQALPLSLPKYQIPGYYANYDTLHATCKMIDAFYNTGAIDSTVKKGSIKKIRVIALEYPTDPAFGDVGPAGEVRTPVARYGGTLYAKKIIGEDTVETDGSANFFVPPRTPLYFQLLDSNGCLIQTMRSYITLMPGEKNQCYGCHEDKNQTPTIGIALPLALNPHPLYATDFGIKEDYVQFRKYIQPIFNTRCAPCHIDTDSGGLNLKGDTIWTGNLTNPANKNACRFWSKSYLNLTDSAKKLVNVIDNNSSAEGIKPFTYGSGKSTLISRLQAGMHGSTITKKEIALLSAWIDLGIPHGGKYNDDMLPTDSAKYEARLKRRLDHEALESQNIAAFRASGQYVGYSAIGDWGWQDPNSRLPASKATLKVRFSKVGGNLVVKVPSEGNLSLIDLRGRKVLSATISKEEFLSQPERNFHLRASSGLYVLKFIGTKLSTEKTIPVF
jgi:hypothetical protein